MLWTILIFFMLNWTWIFVSKPNLQDVLFHVDLISIWLYIECLHLCWWIKLAFNFLSYNVLVRGFDIKNMPVSQSNWRLFLLSVLSVLCDHLHKVGVISSLMLVKISHWNYLARIKSLIILSLFSSSVFSCTNFLSCIFLEMYFTKVF